MKKAVLIAIISVMIFTLSGLSIAGGNNIAVGKIKSMTFVITDSKKGDVTVECKDKKDCMVKVRKLAVGKEVTAEKKKSGIVVIRKVAKGC